MLPIHLIITEIQTMGTDEDGNDYLKQNDGY